MEIAFNGQKLRELREKMNISQYELSLETNTERTDIMRLERGDRKNPSMLTVCKLAEYFGIPEEDLLIIT